VDKMLVFSLLMTVMIVMVFCGLVVVVGMMSLMVVYHLVVMAMD